MDQRLELVTAVVVDDENMEEDVDEDKEDDRDPLIRKPPGSGGRRRPTRVIYDNARLETRPRSRARCSVQQVVMSLLGLITTAAVIFILVTMEREEDTRKTLTPGLDYMDFKQPKNMISFQEMMEDNFSFNMSSSGDVMVFLHMQKTGGTTFGKHLVQDIDLERPCDCHRRRTHMQRRKLKCQCFTPNGRYRCVDTYLRGLEPEVRGQRRYFYVTFLRDPVQRYLSEYKHVKRGATWREQELRCGNRSWADLVDKCYGHEDEESDYDDWAGVGLKEFMACPTNLAVNRQTRMLADLTLVDCYNTSSMPVAKREAIMVASAKTNLERMAFFGLTEQQAKSQYLFEETFNLRFKKNFEQLEADDTHSGSTQLRLEPSVLEEIGRLNHLDLELHRFATQLLLTRYQVMSEADEHLGEHLQRLGQESYQMSSKQIDEENYGEAVTAGEAKSS